jgi:hypothetical protein
MKYKHMLQCFKACFTHYKLMHEWMMLKFMKCKCKYGSQTPEVLQQAFPLSSFLFGLYWLFIIFQITIMVQLRHPNGRTSPSTQSRTRRSSSDPIHSFGLRARCSPCPMCKSMFQVIQMFHLDVASISSWCWKSRAKCCTCCSGYTRIF